MKVNTWRGDNEDKVAGPRPSLISLESKRPPGTFAHRTSFTKSQAGQKGPAGGGEGSFYSHSSFSCHRHQGRFLEPDEIYFRQCFLILWAENSHWLSGIDIAHCLMSFTPVRLNGTFEIVLSVFCVSTVFLNFMFRICIFCTLSF